MKTNFTPSNEKYAAIACGTKLYRVCYLDKHNEWYPVWDIPDFHDFETADKAAQNLAIKNQCIYINMR